MSEEWQAYVKDPRTICKYGTKCYQKNPEHHKTYKHPPQKKRTLTNQKPNSKRFKPSPEDTAIAKKETSPNKNTTEMDYKISEEASSSTQTDFNVIKLPEQISYHDMSNDHAIFKELFLVDMPSDFFHFYQCLSESENYEKTLAAVSLELIGPFDLLQGILPVLDDKDLYLIHWRFFYDPPEFQAVLKKKGKSEYHIGYYRDDPEGSSVFLASADSSKGCHIKPMADNIFGAVYSYLQNEKKTSPFTSMACQKLMEEVKKWAEKHNYSLQEYDIKKRLTQTVTKTFHGAGIVVPYNKKTQLGYRRLVDTDANIRKLFTKLETAKSQSEKDKILSELQPVITYASIAVDECDFGTGLEVGIDLFCSGLKELQPNALSSLCAVYSLLKRDAFSKIIQAHIKYRRKGPNMSILSVSEK